MQYAVLLFYVALAFAFLAQTVAYLASDRSRLRKLGLFCGLGSVLIGAVATKLTSSHLENLVHFLLTINPAADKL